MKNDWLRSLTVGAALIGFTAVVQAIPVAGTIQISGEFNLNTTSLLTATAATFPNAIDGTVTSGTLSYSDLGVTGSPVTFNNFTFAAVGPNVVAPLWTFTNAVNGWTYTFNLSSITGIQRLSPVPGTDTLGIFGLGSVNITGAGSPYELTNANWSFNVTDTSGGTNTTFNFAFNDSNTAADRVPEGGMTLMLLGTALAGLGLLRRILA